VSQNEIENQYQLALTRNDTATTSVIANASQSQPCSARTYALAAEVHPVLTSLIESSHAGGTPLSDAPSSPLLWQSDGSRSLRDLSHECRAAIAASVLQRGAVLLRGYAVRSPLDVREFAASFGVPLASYEFGSTPRRKVAAHVYSSTEYPAHQSIPLHNEQSYTSRWPERLWFMCLKPAAHGGETPLADSRAVFTRLPAPLREEFTRRELLYVRNYGPHLDLPWQAVFGSEDPRDVERYCAAHGIEWEWKASGELRTRERRPAAIQHPTTGEWVWFNQAHLFHVSNLPEPARSSLLASVLPEDLPRNVYFGDGEPIAAESLALIREVYAQLASSFVWQTGDVLMLDNLLVAHGRNPFQGDRKLVVAMA
jgi:alpha-ketoglutarate-dependent taurine dioxygenase